MVSAAFATVDHDILLQRLQATGVAFKWFQSYFTGRTRYTAVPLIDYRSSHL